jgi:soluble lytic murein transglycosylase-like protein
MRFCSTLVWSATLATMVVYAGEPVGQPQRITSVVRADLKSGRLVRSVIVTPRSVGEQRVAETVIAPRVIPESTVASALEPEAPKPVAAPPSNFDEAVDRIAAQQSVHPHLIHSVIKVESNYNVHAVSPKGAQGLMQLIPSTARRFGVADSFNPMQNIQGGAKYLKYLLNLYNNDYALALAAYNAGEAAVAKYGGVPPFKETQNYLHLVADQLKKLNKAAEGAGQAQPVTQPAEAPPDGLRHMQKIVDRDGSVRYVSR